mgnify:CR=1 FL=1
MGERAWLRKYKAQIAKIEAAKRSKESKLLSSNRQQNSLKTGINDTEKKRQKKVAPDSETSFFCEAVCCACGKKETICGQASVRRAKRIGSKWQCRECLMDQREKAVRKETDNEIVYRSVILKTYGNKEITPIHPDSLDLTTAIYLLGFIEVLKKHIHANEGLQLNAIGEELAPTRQLGLEILIRLHRRDLISVHTNSPVDAFFGSQAEHIRYDRVNWFIAGYQTIGELNDLEQRVVTCTLSVEGTAEWVDVTFDLWKKIAFAECWQFFHLYLGLYDIIFYPGEKSKETIRALLVKYPASTVCTFIWEAIRDTASYAKKNKNVPKDKAYNSIVKSIEYHVNRAQIQKVTVLPRKRDYRCPQTMLSKVFFDTVLGIGEGGYTTSPNRNQLTTMFQLE